MLRVWALRVLQLQLTLPLEVEELQAVAGIGPTLALQIHQALQGSADDAPTGESAPAGINTATGEIIET